MMGEMSQTLQDYVESTTKKLVDVPSAVDVNISVSTKTIIVQIKVDQTDCGKVIGKRGRTIEALKILCQAIKNTNFSSDSRAIMVEVLEDEDSKFNYRKNLEED